MARTPTYPSGRIIVEVFGTLERWPWLAGEDFEDLDAGGLLMGRSVMWGLPGGTGMTSDGQSIGPLYSGWSWDGWRVEEGQHTWTTPQTTSDQGSPAPIGVFQVASDARAPLPLVPLLSCIGDVLDRLGKVHTDRIRITATPGADERAPFGYLQQVEGWFEFSPPGSAATVGATASPDAFQAPWDTTHHSVDLTAGDLPAGFKRATGDGELTGELPEWSWTAIALAAVGLFGVYTSTSRYITIDIRRTGT